MIKTEIDWSNDCSNDDGLLLYSEFMDVLSEIDPRNESAVDAELLLRDFRIAYYFQFTTFTSWVFIFTSFSLSFDSISSPESYL